jgi:hypothetical protein
VKDLGRNLESLSLRLRLLRLLVDELEQHGADVVKAMAPLRKCISVVVGTPVMDSPAALR